MRLGDVLGVCRPPCMDDFISFLQVAEVYGGGYLDDVDYTRSNLRNTQTHTEAICTQLTRLIECYDICLYALKVQKAESVVGKLPVYHSQFTSLLVY